MIVEKNVKIWLTAPISFAIFRDKLMDFCYEHHVAPDDVAIAPYVRKIKDAITETGIQISIERDEA